MYIRINSYLVLFGIVNFYRKFIPNCAGKLLLLTRLLKSQRKTNAPITLSSDVPSSFEFIKKEVAFIPLLAHPLPDTQFSLAVDASDSTVGAVLQQSFYNSTQPLALFSNLPKVVQHF